MTPPAQCRECQAELWGKEESFGLCLGCQEAERAEQEERDAWYDPQSGPLPLMEDDDAG